MNVGGGGRTLILGLGLATSGASIAACGGSGGDPEGLRPEQFRDQRLRFEKITLLESSEESKPEEREVELILDPEEGTLLLHDDEEPGHRLLARVPYERIAQVVYRRDAGGLFRRLTLSDATHLLRVNVVDVAAFPGGSFLLKLDGDNYRHVLTAVEGQLDILVEGDPVS